MQMAVTDRMDATLVEASLRGDREAFGEIVDRYRPLVASIAYSGTGDGTIKSPDPQFAKQNLRLINGRRESFVFGITSFPQEFLEESGKLLERVRRWHGHPKVLLSGSFVTLHERQLPSRNAAILA